jgi:hypothetical protein
MGIRRITVVFLLIATIIGSTFAIVLDLPANTPGIQLVTQNKTINGAHNVPCIHVIVHNTLAYRLFIDEKLKPLNAKERADYASSAAEGNIYFPINGVQPTTEEAVILSGANVPCANQDTDPITKWYMRMFGWIPEDDLPTAVSHDDTRRLTLGFDDTKKKDSSIIFLPTVLINSTIVNNHMVATTLTRRQAFWHLFRVIASNPVGRVLLYRLLIEIRRKNEQNWCLDSTLPLPTLEKRNKYRGLCVEWREYNAFSMEQARLGFNCETNVSHPCIAQKTNDNWRIVSPPISSQHPDIGLFHELCHWYHYLRHTKRYLEERTACDYEARLNGTDTHNKTLIHMGQYFWTYAIEADNKWKVSAFPWVSHATGAGYHVNFEEIRNILGTCSYVNGYINGDDLSENLYRLSRSQYVRFSHSAHPYYENETVIEKAINSVSNNAHFYGIDVSIAANHEHHEIIQDYSSANLLEGFNHCKYPKNEVDCSSIVP